MPIALILQALAYAARYGPDAVEAGKKIVALIRDNHPNLTPADIAEMDKFASKTAEDYLAEAGGAPALPAAARSDAPAAVPIP